MFTQELLDRCERFDVVKEFARYQITGWERTTNWMGMPKWISHTVTYRHEYKKHENGNWSTQAGEEFLLDLERVRERSGAIQKKEGKLIPFPGGKE